MSDEDPVQKSKVHKQIFLELFYNAQKLRDISDNLREFMENEEVMTEDRDEIQLIIEKRIAEEKAAKKKEKASKSVSTSDLASTIKNVTGIDLSMIKSKSIRNLEESSLHLPQEKQNVVQAPIINFNSHPVVNPMHHIPISHPIMPPPVIVPPYSTQMMNPPNMYHQQPSILKNIEIVGVRAPSNKRAGMTGFRPEDPTEKTLLEDVPPIPQEFISEAKNKKPEIAEIPIELLPPSLRETRNGRSYRRKTLQLAGARPRKSPIVNNNVEEKVENCTKDVDVSSSVENLDSKTPLSVKRFHARQLAKETGMSLEDAMNEIEEQCKEFSKIETSKCQRNVKHGGGVVFGIDHSRGLPGIDRPPKQKVVKSERNVENGPVKKPRLGTESWEKRTRREDTKKFNREMHHVGRGNRNPERDTRSSFGKSKHRYYKEGSSGGYKDYDAYQGYEGYDRNNYSQDTYENDEDYEGYYEKNKPGEDTYQYNEAYDEYYNTGDYYKQHDEGYNYSQDYGEHEKRYEHGEYYQGNYNSTNDETLKNAEPKK